MIFMQGKLLWKFSLLCLYTAFDSGKRKEGNRKKWNFQKFIRCCGMILTQTG